MEYRIVGSSGIEISRVGLGGYQLGPEPDETPDVDRAVHVIESAIACGVNWLDTSENYLAIAGSRDGRHMEENAGAVTVDMSEVLPEIENLIRLGPTMAA
jgi:aryl-alcohol dehydrogenase-like predicted oxidoreductase